VNKTNDANKKMQATQKTRAADLGVICNRGDLISELLIWIEAPEARFFIYIV